jgi:hypothetical protein
MIKKQQHAALGQKDPSANSEIPKPETPKFGAPTTSPSSSMISKEKYKNARVGRPAKKLHSNNINQTATLNKAMTKVSDAQLGHSRIPHENPQSRKIDDCRPIFNASNRFGSKEEDQQNEKFGDLLPPLTSGVTKGELDANTSKSEASSSVSQHRSMQKKNQIQLPRLNSNEGKRASGDIRSKREAQATTPRRPGVIKGNQETGMLEELFRLNSDEVKTASGLRSAARMIINCLGENERIEETSLLEKFECHAEALLSDEAFVKEFQGCEAINDIARVCTDKKWWKQLRISQHQRPLHKLASYSIASSEIDQSQDDAMMETPPPAHTKKGKKGTPLLRPPGVPAQARKLTPTETDYADTEEAFGSETSQGLSRGIHPAHKLTRKRKFDECQDTSIGHSRKQQSRDGVLKRPLRPISQSLKFGRGRPPLTTLPVSAVIIFNSNDRYL